MTVQNHSGSRAAAVIGQIALYAALAGVTLLFSTWPEYRQLEPDQALIKLSIVHEPQLLHPCRQRTAEELAQLPPNMRAPLLCTRERAPLVVEVDLDGRLAFRQVAQPSGLSRDGRATLYHRLVTTAGRHVITVRLRDRADVTAFDYQRTTSVELRPAQIVVIDFEPAQRTIVFR